jgi:hypothetical protein
MVCASIGWSLLGGVAIAGQGHWVVAMPPFSAEGGQIVADTSAPLSAWVREGHFATEAACETELRDETTRATTAVQVTSGFNDARLTQALQKEVIEAVREARCVRAD